MTTVPQHQPLHQRQQQQQHYGLNAPLDAYDPDEGVSRDSPPMKALDLRIKPSPSTSPEIPPGQVSFSPPPTDGRTKSNRQKIRPVSGDAVLVSYLDNGRHPEIAQEAANQALPADEEEDEDNYEDDSVEYSSDDGRRGSSSCPDAIRRIGGKDTLSQARDSMTDTTVLQAVAVDALQAVAAEAPRHHVLHNPATDISISTLQLSIHDDHLSNIARHPRDVSLLGSHLRRTGGPAMLTPSELPPLLDSPKSESNGGQSLNLPSIRSTLSDINLAEPPTPVDRDQSTRHGGHAQQAFSRSPPVGVPRFHAMSSSHVSPPISPNEAYQRSLPSPHSLPASSPFYANGLHHRACIEYTSNGPGDTPSTDHTTSTPATTASIADRMSIDGITNPQIGYVCHVVGCMAPPFQTQYLLNSHANVHSSARPHYCRVPGCPRSEGGKGFKRKNEMIRHGLVHDSPGYVCPFCADREHKYPRPDNLQRHVRVHHVDKDKDDPRLRDVLSQRPDGPNRGRRRRGAPP